MAAALLLLDGEAEALTRRAVELALAGEPMALRPDGIETLPRTHPAALSRARRQFCAAADRECRGHRRADEGIAMAIADGLITPGEGETIARILGNFAPAIEAGDSRRRLTALECHNAGEEAVGLA